MREEKSRERFERETAGHEMEVIRDDGLYRHVRFQKPGTMIYHYDLVTWPGYLAIVGDCGDYVFSRITDMFDFFTDHGHGINPQYWSEKLQAPKGDAAQKYSYDVFVARVKDWLKDINEYGDVDPDDMAGLRLAVDEQLLSSDDARHSEDAAFMLLRDFDHKGRYIDAWEWSLRDYDWSFLWCCWAIVWGIDQYRAAQKPRRWWHRG